MGAPMGPPSDNYWFGQYSDSEFGVIAEHLAALRSDPALSASLQSRATPIPVPYIAMMSSIESKLLEAINDCILRSPNDFRARLQALAVPDPTSVYQGIPISFLVAAIAMNAIPSVSVAAAICSSADKIMGRVSTASRSAVRVLAKSSSTTTGPVSALADDWVTVDALEFEAGMEAGGA